MCADLSKKCSGGGMKNNNKQPATKHTLKCEGEKMMEEGVRETYYVHVCTTDRQIWRGSYIIQEKIFVHV